MSALMGAIPAGIWGRAGRAAAKIKNPLEDIKYTNKVLRQMQKGDYHSFPRSVDAFGAEGKITKITGGDKIVRTKVEISGGYCNKEGAFEYILDSNGTCNHRLFNPQ